MIYSLNILKHIVGLIKQISLTHTTVSSIYLHVFFLLSAKNYLISPICDQKSRET